MGGHGPAHGDALKPVPGEIEAWPAGDWQELWDSAAVSSAPCLVTTGWSAPGPARHAPVTHFSAAGVTARYLIQETRGTVQGTVPATDQPGRATSRSALTSVAVAEWDGTRDGLPVGGLSPQSETLTAPARAEQEGMTIADRDLGGETAHGHKTGFQRLAAKLTAISNRFKGDGEDEPGLPTAVSRPPSG